MEEFKYEDAYLFRTPPRILELFMDPEAGPFYKGDIRKAVEKELKGQDIRGIHFIYPPEIDFLDIDEINTIIEAVPKQESIISKDDLTPQELEELEELEKAKQKENDRKIEELLQPIALALNKIREEIETCLRERGATVLRLEQEPKAAYHEKMKENIWLQDASKLSGYYFKISHTPNAINLERPFIHPNLMDETHWKISNSNDLLISRASDHKISQNFIECLDQCSKTEKLEILLGAMKGCEYLHKKGYVHCDIKLENILVERKDETKKGILFDLESLSKVNIVMPRNRVVTTEYWDLCYYGDYQKYSKEKKVINIEGLVIDPEQDVFSFGIALLKLCKIPWDFERLMCKMSKEKDVIKKEKILLEYFDEYWPPHPKLEKIQRLVKSMLRSPGKRPTLLEIMNEMEELIEIIDDMESSEPIPDSIELHNRQMAFMDAQTG